MDTKSITIKAFQIKTTNAEPFALDFQEILKQSLDKSDNVEKRFMPLSKQDVDQEGDFLSYYDNIMGVLFGAVIRMKKGTATQILKQQLKEKIIPTKNFVVSSDDKRAGIVHNCVYFCLLQNLLAINCGNSIKSFQTYINWFININNSKKNMYYIEPLLADSPEIKLEQIKNLCVKEDYFKNSISNPTSFNSIQNLKKEVIKDVFSDVPEFKNIDFNNVLSAQILFKILRNSKDRQEDREKALKALLKSGFSENIEVKTKDGKTIKGDTFELKKIVNIEISENGFLSDEQIKQEMVSFLENKK